MLVGKIHNPLDNTVGKQTKMKFYKITVTKRKENIRNYLNSINDKIRKERGL